MRKKYSCVSKYISAGMKRQVTKLVTLTDYFSSHKLRKKVWNLKATSSSSKSILSRDFPHISLVFLKIHLQQRCSPWRPLWVFFLLITNQLLCCYLPCKSISLLLRKKSFKGGEQSKTNTKSVKLWGQFVCFHLCCIAETEKIVDVAVHILDESSTKVRYTQECFFDTV